MVGPNHAPFCSFAVIISGFHNQGPGKTFGRPAGCVQKVAAPGIRIWAISRNSNDGKWYDFRISVFPYTVVSNCYFIPNPRRAPNLAPPEKLRHGGTNWPLTGTNRRNPRGNPARNAVRNN